MLSHAVSLSNLTSETEGGISHAENDTTLYQNVAEYSAEEMEYSATAEAYGGEAAYHAAREAGETELDYRQWVQVRTPAFKAWFGDWENDPDNASKVINPNTGEPLVVYHGTDADFDVFDIAHLGEATYSNANYTSNAMSAGIGHWFSTRNLHEEDGYGERSVAAFLNIRNPVEYNNLIHLFSDLEEHVPNNEDGERMNSPHDFENYEDITEYAQKYTDAMREYDYDGVYIYRDEEYGGSSLVAFHPNQIKSATDNTGAFSADSDSILYQGARTAVASLSGTEIAADLNADNVIEKVRDWFKANLQGKLIHREGLGDIRITGKSWKKIKRGLTTDIAKAQLIPAIPDILQHGEYKGRRELEKGRTDSMVAFHFFEADVNLNGQVMPVGVMVGEDAYGNLVYNINHHPEDLHNKKAAHFAQEESPGLDGSQGTDAFEQSIKESGFNINVLKET